MKRALLALLLLAAPSLAHAQTNLRVWHAYRGQEEAALVAAARAFEASEPGVHVLLVAQPFGAYASKLGSAIPTGNGPDLFIDTHDRVSRYANEALLAEVDHGPLAARMDEAHLAAFLVEGTARGVPLSLKCGALYVNDVRVADVDAVLSDADLLAGRYIVLRRGKKAYHVLEVR